MPSIDYTLFHNIDGGFQRGYQPGDRLATGWTDTITSEHTLTDPEVAHLAEWLFNRHNRDDRPDGRTAPSLSVGDVITIGHLQLTVQREGFTTTTVNPDDYTGTTWLEWARS